MVLREESITNLPMYIRPVDVDNMKHNTYQKSNSDVPQSEPIAIIGIGCKLPGGVSSASKLWDFLVEGRSGHCHIPASRFNADGFYHPNGNRPGSVNATGGYFIDEDIRLFENSFFDINNMEAKYIDPQQRKLLEVVYECFESASAPLHKLSGANIGCYVANFTTDYQLIQSKDPEYFHRYSATGMGLSILANRISHVFNLTGPSLVLDTACSSSLYCLHTACAALNAEECDAAIVAGANLIQSPELHLAAVKAGILSGTSTCHTFDACADGYGRAEGVGALLLKRLSDAIRDKDPIRSVIRGTAVNSNGKTSGITLPSVEGQESVIRKAYAKAGLSVDETDYIEAHGTGTSVGDPIEIEALSRVFQHKLGHPTLVGSVKTNLGHSEAVSGISSVIKVTLALENGLIPPTIGIKNINPNLKLHERNVEVVTKLTQWPQVSVPRASINSFGYGGSNAHAILEAAGAHVRKIQKSALINTTCDRSTFLLPFSANSDFSLTHRVADLASIGVSPTSLVDLAYTLGSRCSKLATRGFLLAHHISLDDDLRPTKLQTIKAGEKSLCHSFAFVFTGQGAQAPEMGRQLAKEFPTYRRTIQDLDSCLTQLSDPPGWTIEDTIFEKAETSQIHHASHSQVVCTATQIALVELLREWGITPEAVIGHSSGEICAAFTAGHLSASEAITIAYYRGFVVSKSALKGAMVAVSLDRDSASKEISNIKLNNKLVVACVNSPESTTISGDCDAIDELIAHLQAQKKLTRKLKTDDKAYHSHHMSLLGHEYEDYISAIKLYNDKKPAGTSNVRMMSTVTNQFVERDLTCTPSYWRTNLESPVLFSDSFQNMVADHGYNLIEIGPHPTLELPIKQIRKKLQLSDSQLLYFPTLFRGKDSVDSMLNLVGNLYLHGYDIDFEKVNHVPSAPISSPNLMTECRVMQNLPKYNWHYDHPLWNESRISSEFRNRDYSRHDLLGSRIPGGSQEMLCWRNVITVKDLPWLADHKLGQTTVFPGTGYLAMVIEALCQTHNGNPIQCPTLSFRQVNFVALLTFPNEEDGIELFTQMRPAQISAISVSGTWWVFDVSSHTEGISTSHARGLVGFESTAPSIQRKIFIPDGAMEQQARRSWYNSLAREGLNFGPAFQSLSEIYNARIGKMQQTASKTHLFPYGNDGMDQESKYIIHPITLDALLQTSIIASSGGSMQDLRTKVPVSIEYAKIMTQGPSNSSGACTIRAASETVGLGIAEVNAELQDTEGNITVQINKARLAAYHGGVDQDGNIDERHPILRVLWKPDISRLSLSENATFTKYTDDFASSRLEQFGNIDIGRFVGALDLLAHENPRLRILELGNRNNNLTASILTALDAEASLKRFQSYTQGSISEGGKFSARRIHSVLQLDVDIETTERLSDKDMFDVIILPSPSTVPFYLGTQSDRLLEHLTHPAQLLFATTCPDIALLDSARFGTLSTIPIDSMSTIMVAKSLRDEHSTKGATKHDIILVDRNGGGIFDEMLQISLSKFLGHNVTRISLPEVSIATIPPKSIVISTVELEEPILINIDQSELNLIKILTNHASTLLWITGGGLFQAQRPDFSLVLGLSRSLMLEQPGLNFLVFDIDDIKTNEDIIENAIYILNQAMHETSPEYEYLQHEGILYTSRFIPEISLNRRFRERQKGEAIMLPLQEAGDCQLSIEKIGQIDTLRYVQQLQSDNGLKPDFVEVLIKSVGLNAKDMYVCASRIDTKDATCSLEFSGIVTRTGVGVSQFEPGDQVVVMAPNHFRTYACVPEWACYKLNGEEDFQVLSTVPLVFSTAIYALHHRANIQPGETILIHSAAGGVGIAAIQCAQLAGADIFATCGTEEKKQFLVDTFGLRRDRIFNSRDSSFLPAILAATSGRGVDVVLNCLAGDRLHDGWRACAEFGRFVEIGNRDILDGGRLDMEVFKRSVTFTAFDLTSLYHSESSVHRAVWKGLLERSIQMLREGKIKAIKPLKTFDASEIVQAFRYFASPDRIGKVVVSLENPESQIKVVPKRYNTSFSPDKCYFLVGCLGGLGRSLAKWMMSQGARKLVFFGRSGTDRIAAKLLVEDLQNAGGDIVVLRGNVNELPDVERAMAQIDHPIGGVVHAAMGLDEALFTEMSSISWHTSVDPKVKGSWNLHNSLKGRDSQLDFFLITSSISGSVGTATESNYCAANAFLDSFARYRRSLGLPAISIGLGMISEVGYLHEHPEIEALLLRKGIHAINEDEFLQICDIALTDSASSISQDNDQFTKAHVLTGLEVLGLNDIRRKGFEGGSHVLDDPRASIIAGALASTDDNNDRDPTDKGSTNLPASVAAALAASSGDGDDAMDDSLLDAIQQVVADKMGNLLLLSPDQLSRQTHLSDFGLDSMLAAEFRLFIFHTFDVDVPFPMLLADTTSVGGLAAVVAEGLLASSASAASGG